MTRSDPDEASLQEQPLIAHLVELRTRILRSVVAVLIVFVPLAFLADQLFTYLATPLLAHLPEGTSMIATEVTTPFLTPFKLAFMCAFFLTVPVVLWQAWGFIAPGLYQHERRFAYPLLVMSIFLFYAGVAFAYYVVMPLVFGFITQVVPDGVAMMTDIARYLDFVLTLFFAFGVAFEIPVVIILMVWAGIVTPGKLTKQRPYVLIGAFAVGMLLTPPDIFSQTLLALPAYLLFEIGIILARILVPGHREVDAQRDSGAP
ncbi:MAG: twin-arginine translocase subunit TatC [Pseudomonadota bacterium]|nr:twin-arginine translocase subunit TatC [Pseudomonadota bacterium]